MLGRVIEKGLETVTVEEDGQLKSKTVNGVDVPLDVQWEVQQQQQHQPETSEL